MCSNNRVIRASPGCAAALAVQKIIEDEGLLGRVQIAGRRLRDLLTQRFGNHRNVGEIRGRGLYGQLGDAL